MAGLIGASDSNYMGVAPAVTFVGLKVLDKNGRGTTSSVITALEFAVANRRRFNIQVVNLSLGHPIFSPAASDPLVQAVNAVRAGLIVVVSAGNMGANPDTGQGRIRGHHLAGQRALGHHGRLRQHAGNRDTRRRQRRALQLARASVVRRLREA